MRDGDIQDGQSAPRLTAVEACAMHLSAHLSRPLSLATLQEAPDHNENQSIEAQVRSVLWACEKTGLRAAFGKIEADRVDPVLLPSIFLVKDDGAIVLHRLEQDTAWIYDPLIGTDVEPVRADELFPRLGGFVLSIQLELGHDPEERAAGVRKHWFWDAVMANRWAYTQVALAAMMINVLALVISLFTMVVYDRILPTGATASLAALSIGVGIALVFDLILKSLRSGFIDHAGQQADIAMGQDLFDTLLETEMAARKESVGAVSATMREFETLRDFFTSATMVAIVDLPFLIIFVMAIFLLAGPLAVVPGLAIPLVLAIGIAAQPILGRIADKVLAEGQAKNAILVETLTGIEAIKAAGAGRQMRARWAEAVRRQSSYSVKSRAVTQGAINLTGFVQQAAQVLIVVFGALLVVSGEITSGILIAAVILTGRALAPLTLISQTLTRLHQAHSSYRSLNALMQAPTEHPSGKVYLSRQRLNGELRFDGVGFAYPGQATPVLENVTFRIATGERVAILGRVGSGKSTIARLMLGLYRPTQGAVLADGVDIRQIDPNDLRRNIGAVLQEPWLVSGTLRDNIALGSIRPSDAEVIAAGRIAGVDEFADRHPSGYNMTLNERGQSLSGGQRQCVALARGLMGSPPILLLDEPTAAMDGQSEATLIGRLKAALPGRTVVVITHRLSLLELVDRVIVIDGGKVIADGPKSQFQKRNGTSGAPS